MGKILRIKLVKSPIGYNKKQKLTVIALGLRKMNDVSEKPDRPEIRGMIRTIRHLVQVEEIEENDR